jgi:hypothetical protein
MFLHAQSQYKAMFYAYSNADILFDTSLVETLTMIENKTVEFDKLLVVGKRSNFIVDKETMINQIEELKSLGTQARLFRADAEDYFITKFNGYPWDYIPDFVVGKRGYDNWLVKEAILHGIPVIDATETLLALHQTDQDGNMAGHSSQNPHSNVQLAGKGYSFYMGQTVCTPMFSLKSNGTVIIQHRSPGISCHHFGKVTKGKVAKGKEGLFLWLRNKLKLLW